MLYLLCRYAEYDPRTWSTPWGAPCDSSGQVVFSGQVAHYTANHGKGGDLYVEDPLPGSVWVYGQKNRRTGYRNKTYALFKDGNFQPLSEYEVVAALSAAPQFASLEQRKSSFINFLLAALMDAEASQTIPTMAILMETCPISLENFVQHGIKLPVQQYPEKGGHLNEKTRKR